MYAQCIWQVIFMNAKMVEMLEELLAGRVVPLKYNEGIITESLNFDKGAWCKKFFNPDPSKPSWRFIEITRQEAIKELDKLVLQADTDRKAYLDGEIQWLENAIATGELDDIPVSRSILCHIGACIFKRTENDPWEPGFVFNEGENGYLDSTGKEVTDIYDMERKFNIFSLNLESVVAGLNKYLVSYTG